MKFPNPNWSVFALSCLLSLGCLLSLTACSDSEEPQPGPVVRPDEFDRPEHVEQRTDSMASARRRADAAFAALQEEPSRSESRVGPQPWPEDLPRAWPRPSQATVVADTRRGTGDRLLLVNLPGPPEQALETFRRALTENGYEIASPEIDSTRRSLRARRGDDQAVLTFFAREEVTRIEILFPARAAG